MDNVLALRLLLAAVIMIAVTAGFLAFYFMKFPENAVVIALSAAATVGITFFVRKREKAARFEVYYKTIQEFGRPIAFGNVDVAFERNGTRFDVDFPKGEHNFYFKVNFHLPNMREKFSIQNKSLATRFADDCQVVQDSPLPPEYLVQSRNPVFLLNFLRNREILDEISNYKASFWGRTLISFDDGAFEMMWTPPVSEQIDGFYQVCQTAVVFHDELKRIYELPR
jgi:hypothetical protein